MIENTHLLNLSPKIIGLLCLYGFDYYVDFNFPLEFVSDSNLELQEIATICVVSVGSPMTFFEDG